MTGRMWTFLCGWKRILESEGMINGREALGSVPSIRNRKHTYMCYRHLCLTHVVLEKVEGHSHTNPSCFLPAMPWKHMYKHPVLMFMGPQLLCTRRDKPPAVRTSVHQVAAACAGFPHHRLLFFQTQNPLP